VDGRVSIRAHYERFPATLKGAFVLRGDDADPHQVRIEAARVSELSGRAGQPMGVETVTLDVAPHLDLFVPFEVPLLDLEPGWYRLEIDVTVDGDAGVVHPGERFVIAWPRGSMRRGSASVGRVIEAGATSVTIDQVDCAPDSVRVTYQAPGPVALALSADETSLPQVDEAFDDDTGRGTVTAYPASKERSKLSISARGSRAPVIVDLP
jgi:hypothetical protein